MEITRQDLIETFLAEHQLAAFATGRKDGSPQLSHVVYDFDGQAIIISINVNPARAHDPRGVALWWHWWLVHQWRSHWWASHQCHPRSWIRKNSAGC